MPFNSDHAIPLAAQSDRCSVLAVVHQLDGVVDLQHLGDLFEQVDAEPLEARVTRIRVIRD